MEHKSKSITFTYPIDLQDYSATSRSIMLDDKASTGNTNTRCVDATKKNLEYLRTYSFADVKADGAQTVKMTCSHKRGLDAILSMAASNLEDHSEELCSIDEDAFVELISDVLGRCRWFQSQRRVSSAKARKLHNAHCSHRP